MPGTLPRESREGAAGTIEAPAIWRPPASATEQRQRAGAARLDVHSAQRLSRASDLLPDRGERGVIERTPVVVDEYRIERVRHPLRGILHLVEHANRIGDLGHVEDLRIDDVDWSLKELVIDTRNWLPGKHVRVSADALDLVDWNSRSITVRLSRQQIEARPEVEA